MSRCGRWRCRTPDRLVSIAAETKGDESGGFQYAFSTEALKDFQERAQSFSDVVGIMPRIGGFVDDGKRVAVLVCGRQRQLLLRSRRPSRGRHALHQPSGSPVHVVLGYSFWMKHFGGDPGVIGAPVRVDGAPADRHRRRAAGRSAARSWPSSSTATSRSTTSAVHRSGRESLAVPQPQGATRCSCSAG